MTREMGTVQGPLAMIHPRRDTEGITHHVLPHLALILTNQASANENNLTIPFIQLTPVHNMLTTPVRAQICSRIPVVNRLCRHNLPLSRPQTPQLSIKPKTRSPPPTRNGKYGPSLYAVNASMPSFTLGMPVCNPLQNRFLL